MSRPKKTFTIFSLLLGCLITVPSLVHGQARLVQPNNRFETLPAPSRLRQRQDFQQDYRRHRDSYRQQDFQQRFGQRDRRSRVRFRQPANVVAIQSFNYPDRFLRHRHFSAVLHKPDHTELFAKDSSFVMRRGLTGRGVSFESVNFPGYFLRHSGHRLKLQKDDGRIQFAKDATFRMVDGLAGSGVSFEPVNLPGHYVRHYGFGFRISKYECKRQFREDATFILR